MSEQEIGGDVIRETAETLANAGAMDAHVVERDLRDLIRAYELSEWPIESGDPQC